MENNKNFKTTTKTWEECYEDEYKENDGICNQCHTYNRCWLKSLERD